MRRSVLHIIICLLVFIIGLYSFTNENPYFIIQKKDVEMKLSKRFPKPVYNFRNNKVTPEGFVLGRKLFYDPILSKTVQSVAGFAINGLRPLLILTIN